jgi:hypothetical protein
MTVYISLPQSRFSPRWSRPMPNFIAPLAKDASRRISFGSMTSHNRFVRVMESEATAGDLDQLERRVLRRSPFFIARPRSAECFFPETSK